MTRSSYWSRIGRAFIIAVIGAGAFGLTGQTFRVRETAGLRRFGYPVRTSFRSTKTTLRLLENNKPIPAQFTQLENNQTDLDFNVSLGPLETREYRIEDGQGPAPKQGLTLEQTAKSFRVKHPGGLTWEIPKNMLGLLSSVRGGRTTYLREGSQGLVLNYRDDTEYRAGGFGHWGVPTEGRVIKSGPLACALRFESMEGLRSSRSVKSVVEMHFPLSKSWVEVRWSVVDPERLVSGLLVDLSLDVEGEPTLVDFGAGGTVYAALHKSQHIVLKTGDSSWSVLLNGEPYAVGKSVADGWAHIMDTQRATAIAVADFGSATNGIAISADGHVIIRRDFSSGGERVMKFWAHFVTMPVQVGAATSPQSMQSPLKIEWYGRPN
jgi:hypothetical protein